MGDDDALQLVMPRQHRWGKTGPLGDLEAALTAAGVPDGAVQAIRAQAPSWPSLSKVGQGSLQDMHTTQIQLQGCHVFGRGSTPVVLYVPKSCEKQTSR